MVGAVLAHATSSQDVAVSTLQEFADVMDRFALFMERGLGVTDVEAVGQVEVETFVRSRRADGAKPSISHMHNRRTVCRYLFRRARELGLRTGDPTVAVDLPRRRPVHPRPLTEDEVRLCRSHAVFHPSDLRHPVAWALAEVTARTSEIPRVLVGNVDMASGSVRLPGSPRSNARTVAFTDWGLIQIRRRLQAAESAPEELLLPMRSRTVPRSTASMAVIEVLRAAGIKAADVRPVSVAAWRAAREYAGGASIEQVAVLLGIPSLDRTAALIELPQKPGGSASPDPARSAGGVPDRSN